MANSFEFTINFLNSSMTKTENATAMIIIQSVIESTLVESKPPISIPVNGIETLASCTKNNNRAKDTKNAIFIALFENTPNEKILSS